jgi:hypothetical protein
MHMHEGLPRRRDVEQRIALRGHLAHAPAGEDHQIGSLDAREKFRVRRDAEIAAIARMQRVEQMRAAKRRHHRQVEMRREAYH